VKKPSRYWKFALFIVILALVALYVVGKYEEMRLEAEGDGATSAGEVPAGVGTPGTGASGGGSVIVVPPAQPAQSASATNGVAAGMTLDDCRLQRQRTRSLLAEQLQALAGDANAPAETRAEASRRLLELATLGDREAEAEAVLAARGYDTVVFIFERGAVVVVARASPLAAQDAAFIGDIVARCAGLSLEDITITARPR
jgi:hypothetical protein